MSRPRLARLLVLTGLASLAACGGESDPLAGVPPTQNPLADPSPIASGGYALPLPSSVYLREDTASATGFRLDFPEGALPVNGNAKSVDPTWLNVRDGFSTAAPILVHFPQGVATANLPSHTDFDASLADDCPTVIVDMQTGERVVHFAEVDAVANDYPVDQALILRPALRLRPGRRYAVGLRRSLVARDGAPLAVPPGFQAILDGRTTGHPLLERVRGRYPEIFEALAGVGVPREDLVLAWDFVTATDELVRSDLLDGRDAALAAMDTGTYTIHIEKDLTPLDLDPAVTARMVQGTIDVPQLLDGDAGNDSRLARDASGRPTVVGTWQAPFAAIIPACAAHQKPVPVVVYGHGLLGSLDEATGVDQRNAAQHVCAIFVATEWRGMCTSDLPSVVLALNDASRVPYVMEKLVQGIVDFIVLARIARTEMVTAPDFMDHGQPLIDPTRVYYYGISQGSILGGSFMAYDPSVPRGVLHVGAANFSMMLERSTDFPSFRSILTGAYGSYLDQQILLTLLQTGWDAVEPVTVVEGLLGRDGTTPIPGVPPKQILMQMAVDDSQVPNLATEYEARLMGQTVLAPSIRVPWGLAAEEGPLPSALTIWDEDFEPKSPLANEPPAEDSGTHQSLRRQLAPNEQIRIFFETGEIVQTCLDAAGLPRTCDCTVPDVCGPEL